VAGSYYIPLNCTKSCHSVSLSMVKGINDQSLIASLISGLGHRRLRVCVAQPQTRKIDFFELHIPARDHSLAWTPYRFPPPTSKTRPFHSSSLKPPNNSHNGTVDLRSYGTMSETDLPAQLLGRWPTQPRVIPISSS
jgi:hypothetical protein